MSHDTYPPVSPTVPSGETTLEEEVLSAIEVRQLYLDTLSVSQELPTGFLVDPNTQHRLLVLRTLDGNGVEIYSGIDKQGKAEEPVMLIDHSLKEEKPNSGQRGEPELVVTTIQYARRLGDFEQSVGKIGLEKTTRIFNMGAAGGRNEIKSRTDIVDQHSQGSQETLLRDRGEITRADERHLRLRLETLQKYIPLEQAQKNQATLHRGIGKRMVRLLRGAL